MPHHGVITAADVLPESGLAAQFFPHVGCACKAGLMLVLQRLHYKLSGIGYWMCWFACDNPWRQH